MIEKTPLLSLNWTTICMREMVERSVFMYEIGGLNKGHFNNVIDDKYN